MQGLLRVLPHALTLTNLAAGCVAAVALVQGKLWIVPWCVLTSAVADFFDGFAARRAGVSGPFGRELDSLADLVSFGLSPALMAYVLLEASGLAQPWPYLGLWIVLMSAVRLARFNVEQADVKHFIGLATPANTLLWFGLLQAWRSDAAGLGEWLANPALIGILVLLTGALLVSSLSYPSNKIDPRRTANWPLWLCAALLIVLPWLVGWLTLPVVMLIYVASGFFWRAPSARHVDPA